MAPARRRSWPAAPTGRGGRRPSSLRRGRAGGRRCQDRRACGDVGPPAPDLIGGSLRLPSSARAPPSPRRAERDPPAPAARSPLAASLVRTQGPRSRETRAPGSPAGPNADWPRLQAGWRSKRPETGPRDPAVAPPRLGEWTGVRRRRPRSPRRRLSGGAGSFLSALSTLNFTASRKIGSARSHSAACSHSIRLILTAI